MKSILAQKATLSFNITNNKMSNKMEISNEEMEISNEEEEMEISERIYQDYQNSGLYFTLEEVRVRIENLTVWLQSAEEQREEILEFQNEIDFYQHQIYNHKIFKTRVRFQEEEEPESKIDILEKKISGVEGVVYQLLGGLFNQETQDNVLHSHIEYLKGNMYTGELEGQPIFPTTRQGDQHEEEIRLLKQQVSKLEDTVALLVRIIRDQKL